MHKRTAVAAALLGGAIVAASVTVALLRPVPPRDGNPPAANTDTSTPPARNFTLVPAQPPATAVAPDAVGGEPIGARPANVHASNAGEEGCLGCHDTAKGPGLKQGSVKALCSGCHPDTHGADSHPSGVPLSPGMTTTLPLTDQQLDCHTCHDPHGSQGPMLRGKGSKLCSDCHQGY